MCLRDSRTSPACAPMKLHRCNIDKDIRLSETVDVCGRGLALVCRVSGLDARKIVLRFHVPSLLRPKDEPSGKKVKCFRAVV
jgi:hypothetical protein